MLNGPRSRRPGAPPRVQGAAGERGRRVAPVPRGPSAATSDRRVRWRHRAPWLHHADRKRRSKDRSARLPTPGRPERMSPTPIRGSLRGLVSVSPLWSLTPWERPAPVRRLTSSCRSSAICSRCHRSRCHRSRCSSTSDRTPLRRSTVTTARRPQTERGARRLRRCTVRRVDAPRASEQRSGCARRTPSGAASDARPCTTERADRASGHRTSREAGHSPPGNSLDRRTG